jgi:hypothetical protein
MVMFREKNLVLYWDTSTVSWTGGRWFSEYFDVAINEPRANLANYVAIHPGIPLHPMAIED